MIRKIRIIGTMHDTTIAIHKLPPIRIVRVRHLTESARTIAFWSGRLTLLMPLLAQSLQLVIGQARYEALSSDLALDQIRKR
jgi:hypothetical protein